MQSLLLSATFYGALGTISFAGILADRYGPKMIVIVATLDYVIITLLTPFLAKWSYYAYFLSRITMGIGEGFIFPCFATIVGKWFTPAEKSTVAAMYTSGNQNKLPVPWKRMLSSRPLITAVFCQYTYNLQASLLQAFLPTFLKEELMLPLSKNGLYTMIPFISQLISKNILGILADYLKRNEIIGHTKCAKIFQSVGSFGSAAVLIALATLPNCENPYLALPLLGLYGNQLVSPFQIHYVNVVVLILGTFFSAGICGFFTCLLCIAPPFSGTVSSIAMIFGMLGNISGPLMLGLVSKMGFTNKWVISFVICSGFSFLAGVVFLIFGSAKVQQWAKVQPPKSTSA
ncbi:hypothetical protein NECAME_01168 [Necator americanus]|uniref:Transporter, major facilitator family protein n=1 Tax=Necator americanus TaxID=51031 RepID=W2SHL9_NECAM|nr:hypothetical protein NECAME_01168 [Necator americanus]ETN69058.1 hypothetical protein NECAME_01168 [Necator americanus]